MKMFEMAFLWENAVEKKDVQHAQQVKAFHGRLRRLSVGTVDVSREPK